MEVREAGLSFKHISKQLPGRSPKSREKKLHTIAQDENREDGLAMRARDLLAVRRPRTLSDRDREQVLRLREEGLSYQAILERLGLDIPMMSLRYHLSGRQIQLHLSRLEPGPSKSSYNCCNYFKMARG